MSYLILQIWIFLLIAALIGLIAGWLMRGGSRGQLNKVNQEWSQRVANLEAERDEYSTKIEELNTASVRQGDMYLKLTEERDILSKRLLESEKGSTAGGKEIANYKQQLKQRESEIEQLQSQFKETTNQLADTQNTLQLAQTQIDGETKELRSGAAQIESYSAKLKEAETSVKSRDEKLEQLHQKLAANLTTLEETKSSLTSELEAERKKASLAVSELEEAKRKLEEYDEQLKVSENTLGDVSKDLKQKQEFFEVARREMDSKLHQGDEHVSELNKTVKAQENTLNDIKGKLEAREVAFADLTKKEQEQRRKLQLAEQQLDETQKALTESSRRQQQLDNELRASQLRVTSLENQADSPQAPRDYSGVASGMLAGGAATAAMSASGSGRSSGWSKLSEMARGGFEKVKEKVEDTTSDVVTATAKASPNDENYRIEVIRSIGNDNRRHLHDMGITTTLNLLEKCADDDGTKLISKALGREPWVVSSWVSIADLLRVKGIDGPMAEVLELSGVYSTKALADANPEKLIQLIGSVNQRVEKVNHTPDIATVAGWIRHAETLKTYI